MLSKNMHENDHSYVPYYMNWISQSTIFQSYQDVFLSSWVEAGQVQLKYFCPLFFGGLILQTRSDCSFRGLKEQSDHVSYM